jgi:hypothetical protein
LTGEDKGGGEKELTSPLTFVLSRKGRERRKKIKKVSSRASSPSTGEDKGGGEKIDNTPHPDPLPQGERRERKRERISSPLT